MLLQLTQRLEDQIVQVLATQPGIGASRIHSALPKTYSLRAVFKELRKLEHEGVVVKLNGAYSLSLAWATNVLTFMENVHERYLDPKCLAKFIPNDELGHGKGEVRWQFWSLRAADLLASQVILALHTVRPDEPMCVVHPHQWPYFIHSDELSQWRNAYSSRSFKRYVIVGSQSALDKTFAKDAPGNNIYSFSSPNFSVDKRNHYAVCGEFVLTLKISKKAALELERAYSTTLTRASLRSYFTSLFRQRHRTVLVVENNRTKAQRWRRRFFEHFGARELSAGFRGVTAQ